MDGSVIQKPKGTGRWYPVTRHRQPDGAYRQQWHGGFATKREAKAALNEVINRLNKGAHVAPSRMTLGEFLRGEWLAGAATALKPSTLDSYDKNIGWHIEPALGAIRLQDLTAGRLNAFYADLLANGRRDGKGGLSPKTVRYIHGILRAALRDAEDVGHVSRNVAAKAKPPKATRSASAMTVWNEHELRRFLAFVRDDSLGAAWRLAAQTGMRRGELLGLRWECVDFERSLLTVQSNLVSVNYALVTGDSKTRAGTRQRYR